MNSSYLFPVPAQAYLNPTSYGPQAVFCPFPNEFDNKHIFPVYNDYTGDSRGGLCNQVPVQEEESYNWGHVSPYLRGQITAYDRENPLFSHQPEVNGGEATGNCAHSSSPHRKGGRNRNYRGARRKNGNGMIPIRVPLREKTNDTRSAGAFEEMKLDSRMRKKVMYSSSVSPEDDYVPPNVVTKEQMASVDPVRYKSKLCVSWETEGKCSYKSKCLFAHGPSELRSHERNWELLRLEGKGDVMEQYDNETVCKGGTPYPKKPFTTLQHYSAEYAQLMEKYGEVVATNVMGKAMEWVF